MRRVVHVEDVFAEPLGSVPGVGREQQGRVIETTYVPVLVDVAQHLVAATRTYVRDQPGVARVALGGSAVGVVLGRDAALRGGLLKRPGAAAGARGRSRRGGGGAGRITRDYGARDERGDSDQTSGTGRCGADDPVRHAVEFDEPAGIPAASSQALSHPSIDGHLNRPWPGETAMIFVVGGRAVRWCLGDEAQ